MDVGGASAHRPVVVARHHALPGQRARQPSAVLHQPGPSADVAAGVGACRRGRRWPWRVCAVCTCLVDGGCRHRWRRSARGRCGRSITGDLAAWRDDLRMAASRGGSPPGRRGGPRRCARRPGVALDTAQGAWSGHRRRCGGVHRPARARRGSGVAPRARTCRRGCLRCACGAGRRRDNGRGSAGVCRLLHHADARRQDIRRCCRTTTRLWAGP